MQKFWLVFLVLLRNFQKFLIQNKEKKLIYLADLDGIGETQVRSIDNFFLNHTNTRITEELMNKLNVKNYSIQNIDGKFSNKKLMFTGGFKNMSRSEAKAIAENNGGKVLGSISKNLIFWWLETLNQQNRKSIKQKY